MELYLDRNLILESAAQLEDADYVLLGVPFDGTSSYRPGSRFAPLEIRKEFLELEAGSIRFHDLGNVDVVYGNAAETVKRVRETVSKALERNNSAEYIILGGEHLITYPVVEALKERVDAVVWLDAHPDLRDEYQGGRLSHACVARRITELGTTLIQYGVRSGSPDQEEFIRENGILSLPPTADFKEVMEAVRDKRVYLSVDLDVLDPRETDGVGNPEPGGLSFNTLESIVEYVSEGCEVAGFDVVEASPVYDSTAAVYAAKLLATHMMNDEKP